MKLLLLNPRYNPELQEDARHTGIFRSVHGGKPYYTARCPVTGIYHGQFPDLTTAIENRLHKSAYRKKIEKYRDELAKVDKRDPKKPFKTGLKIKEGEVRRVVEMLTE